MPIKQFPYRDIRTDLKARLIAATAKRDEQQKLVEELDNEVLLLTKMLDQEERRFGAAKIEQPPTQAPLPDFIVESLSRGKMDKDDLRHFAETKGIAVDGRSLHATLINLIRAGKIKEVEEGFYDLP